MNVKVGRVLLIKFSRKFSKKKKKERERKKKKKNDIVGEGKTRGSKPRAPAEC